MVVVQNKETAFPLQLTISFLWRAVFAETLVAGTWEQGGALSSMCRGRPRGISKNSLRGHLLMPTDYAMSHARVLGYFVWKTARST